MILKNLMEDQQLDLNRPFLSVRRLPIAAASSESGDKRKTDSSLPKTHSLPVYKSELKSGPIRNPGTVPFLWEQIPGRPKDESRSLTYSHQRPPVAPKLPPGRILNAKQQHLEKDSEGAAITRSQSGDVPSRSLNASSFNELLMKHDSFKQDNENKESSDSEDDSEAYMDARDTLSRSESSFLNCSVSGLSGLDGPYVKPFGTFSDPQTRDFMMGRFLPAAKAMASESPHYTTWKQPVAREQPRQVSTIASVDKRQTLYQHRPTNVQHYVQSREVEESKDDSDNEPEYSSAKVCGLLPQFCLLSPVPGLKMKGHVPISSVLRSQAKSSYGGSCSKSEDKLSRDAVREHKSIGGHQTAYLHEQRTKPKSEFNQMTSKRNCQKLDGSSLYRRLQGNGISPLQNEVSEATLHEDKEYIRIPRNNKNSKENRVDQHGKGPMKLREILANNSTEWELGAASPVVEKTLYIDTVHSVKAKTDSMENDFEILGKKGEKEETHSADSFIKDIKQLDVVDEKEMSQPKHLEYMDSSLLSSSFISSHDVEVDKTDDFRRDQNLIQDAKALTSSKIAEESRNELENLQVITESNNSDSSHGSSHLPLPPPLPKSPSESWLSRTLTAVPSRNQSSLGMRNHNKSQACKIDPKWETIVKTSNMHHGHLRFSEELLAPIQEG